LRLSLFRAARSSASSLCPVTTESMSVIKLLSRNIPLKRSFVNSFG
jgi:hypothetical protein